MTGVLLNPEQHISPEAVTQKLSRMSIRLGASSTEPAQEFTLAEFELGQALKGAVVWFRVKWASILSSRSS